MFELLDTNLAFMKKMGISPQNGRGLMFENLVNFNPPDLIERLANLS